MSSVRSTNNSDAFCSAVCKDNVNHCHLYSYTENNNTFKMERQEWGSFSNALNIGSGSRLVVKVLDLILDSCV